VQAARYVEITGVEIERGVNFAELRVKTRGLLGGKTLHVTGLGEQDAERAKAFIEERMAHDSFAPTRESGAPCDRRRYRTMYGCAFVSGTCKQESNVCGKLEKRRKRMSRNRSPWFSFGYLLGVALIVLVIVLIVLWLA
jgi:hypothetical protein